MGAAASAHRVWRRSRHSSVAPQPQRIVTDDAPTAGKASAAVGSTEQAGSSDGARWEAGSDFMLPPEHYRSDSPRRERFLSESRQNGRESKPEASGRRSRRSFLAGDRVIQQLSAFSPAMAHWELVERSAEEHSTGLKPSAWPCFAALLFVDISGFTNLSTRLNVDDLQRHINLYFSRLTDIILKVQQRRGATSCSEPPQSAAQGRPPLTHLPTACQNGGDVLRFAGDAIFCAWALPPVSSNANCATATTAACATALELMSACGSYHIPEADTTL